MNELMVIEPNKENQFIFSAREILERAGIDKKNMKRTLSTYIDNNEIITENIDYKVDFTVKTTKQGAKRQEEDRLLTKKAMEFVLISLRTEKANNLRRQLIEKMNEQKAISNPIEARKEGLKIAYALIESEKKLQQQEKEAEMLILKAKGKQARAEVITKINNLAKKIGSEMNNGDYRSVWARLYRCFAANNKRYYWGSAMQAKNHLEYIGEFGGVEDLRILHEILVSFVGEDAEFFVQDLIDSSGKKRKAKKNAKR